MVDSTSGALIVLITAFFFLCEEFIVSLSDIFHFQGKTLSN